MKYNMCFLWYTILTTTFHNLWLPGCAHPVFAIPFGERSDTKEDLNAAMRHTKSGIRYQPVVPSPIIRSAIESGISPQLLRLIVCINWKKFHRRADPSELTCYICKHILHIFQLNFYINQFYVHKSVLCPYRHTGTYRHIHT